MTRTRLAAAGLLVALGACGQTPAPVAADQPSSTDAIVYIKSNVREADVSVDGRVVGRLRKGSIGFALEPGKHQITISRDEYFTAYLELQLARSEHKNVKLDLAPVLP